MVDTSCIDVADIRSVEREDEITRDGFLVTCIPHTTRLSSVLKRWPLMQ